MKTKVLLCSISKNNFYDNTKSMFLYLKKHTDYDVRYVINDDDEKRAKLNQKFPNCFISLKSKEGKQFLKESHVWLIDGGMPTKNIFLMKDKKIINFWHGVPLKTIGWLGCLGLHRVRVYLQLYLFQFFTTAFITTSKKLVDIISKSFLLPKNKVKVLGQPRNNDLNKLVDKVDFKKFYKNIDARNKFILYAPTWRKSKYGASFNNYASFFPFEDMDMDNFKIFLKENNITIFLRPHPLENLQLEESENIKIFDVKKVESINDYLSYFDLLIVDYSSIYIDYLLTGKPVLFLPYDISKYDGKRGFNFNYDEVTPGPKPNNYIEFKNEIIKLLSDEKYYKKERLNINDFFNEVKENPCQNNLNYIKELIGK